MTLPLDDLSLLDEPSAPLPAASARAGAPLEIPLELIDEDPDQPRTEFDAEALAELAQTIALRGVRQPISVRPHPRDAGHWMLNFGARRLRASQLAGKATIPAFVDATADSFDQVIENEQRQSLTPIELALFVKRQLANGQKLVDVGRRLGKSRSYMTFVGALIDAPDAVLQVYRSGACRGLSELYELRRAFDKSPEQVGAWIAGREVVSRADIQALKGHLQGATDASGSRRSLHPEVLPTKVESKAKTATSNKAVAASARSDSHTEKTAPRAEVVLEARWHGRPVRVQLYAVVTEAGNPFVRIVDQDGRACDAPINELSELRLICVG